jgi:5-hydroxyisourate hydrolase
VKITTHVLDVSRGTPASGIAVSLEHRAGEGEDWRLVGRSQTSTDGRVADLAASGGAAAGQYLPTFETRAYFAAQSVATLYPAVVIIFDATPGEAHYHVPLLLSPFGYSTYRGS